MRQILPLLLYKIHFEPHRQKHHVYKFRTEGTAVGRDLIAAKNLFLLVTPNAAFVFKKFRRKAEAVLAAHPGAHPGGIRMYNSLFFIPSAFFMSRQRSSISPKYNYEKLLTSKSLLLCHSLFLPLP